MAGFGFLVGGAMAGYGQDIVDQAKAKREAALKQLEEDRADTRMVAQQKFEHDESAIGRKAAVDNAQGEMIDLGGGKYGVRKGTTVMPLTDATGNDITVKPNAGYRLLTQDEVKAAGLTPGKAYQMALSGDDKDKISAIGGDGTTVNVSGTEKGYDKTLGEGYGKTMLDIQNSGRAAQKALSSLDVMEQSMADPNFYSGSGAGVVDTLKRAAVAMGGDPKQVTSMETFNAMAKQTALAAMGGSLGTGFSNADRDFVEAQVPSLDSSPEGNKALISIQRKIAQRTQDIAKVARDYASQPKHDNRIDPGFDDYLANWADQNPLFPKASGGTTGGAATQRTSTGVEWSLHP